MSEEPKEVVLAYCGLACSDCGAYLWLCDDHAKEYRV